MFEFVEVMNRLLLFFFLRHGTSVAFCRAFSALARCERFGGGFSLADTEDYDDVQLDDTAGAQNERRDVARPLTSTRTSLKLNVVQPAAAAASATCRMSTELICFTIVVVVIIDRMSSSSSRTSLQLISAQ